MRWFSQVFLKTLKKPTALFRNGFEISATSVLLRWL
ncbi:hypothetical protein CF65_01823 [Aggregatibacter actinomycetemcomitans HK1651]|nr:hypothetical protein CF65_01823 [Aggregatibacter actinomycetemcomitans HK1651]